MIKALLILIIAPALFRLGGWGKYPCLFIPGFNAKMWRLLILPYFMGAIYHNYWAVVTYALALNAFSYGESPKIFYVKWIRERYDKYTQWFVYGFLVGLASLPVLGWLALIHAVISGVVFLILMDWSNEGIDGKYLDHKWVELGFGASFFVMYCFK